MSWTLLYAGQEKTFAEWGLSQLHRSLASQDRDLVTFIADGTLYDAEELFAVFSPIVIKRDGVPWFQGLVTRVPRAGAPEAESMSYQVDGPWWYLDNLVYQQTWQIYTGKTTPPTPYYKSHCFLNQRADGSRLTTAEQIADALNYANAQAVVEYGSAVFQLGAGFPAISPPLDEVKDVTCAEVIRKQLRWAPDAVTWFDYATTPPTIHCGRRADLTAVDLAVDQGAPAARIDITPRADLVLPVVILNYEISSTIDGVHFTALVVRKVPSTATGREFGAFAATIDLQGATISNALAQITCGAIDINSLDWWKSKVPWLASDRVREITFAAPTRSGVNAYPRELLTGQLVDWMNFGAESDTITARFNFEVTDAAGQLLHVPIDKVVTVKVKATNATTGTYRQQSVDEYAEPIPVGLEQFIYDAVSVLQYDGQFVLQEEECSGLAGMGTVLNLTGSRAEWATMRALVQSVNEDVDNGTTTLTFGPSKHLGPADLIELLRVNRQRIIRNKPKGMGDGTQATGDLELGKETSTENTTSGAGSYQIIKVIGDGSAGDLYKIILDAKTAAIDGTDIKTAGLKLRLADCKGRTLSVREIDICIDDVTKKMLILASEPYDAP